MLADQAQRVRQGLRKTYRFPVGTDEIGRIGATLSDLVGHLQQEKQTLATLNAELDARGRADRAYRTNGQGSGAMPRSRVNGCVWRTLHDTLAHLADGFADADSADRQLRDRLDPAGIGRGTGAS